MNSQDIPRKPNSKSEALTIMKRSLLDSFQQLEGIDKCGVLFSGGVDSSLAAVLSDRFCDEICLLTSHAEGSRDSQIVFKSAKKLNMHLIETQMDSENVWSTLPELIHAIQRYNRMDVEIALPIFLSSKEAKKIGIMDIVSGQGPDELFAGYARHVEVLKNEGGEALQRLLCEEISKTHDVNIDRDEKAITYNNVAAYFPYLDSEFIKIALSIPESWKIDLGKTPSRKVIFRKLAIEMGLPIELAMKPKDATQYSSGSSKIIIESIRNHILNSKSISRRRASAIVQDVFETIAFHVGVTDKLPINLELKIDMEATKKFHEKKKSIIPQQ